MGIFSRVADIISSNISAMLDKAEDPEKLIKLMIREMEDTLVEIKASCAGVMAAVKKTERQIAEARERESAWANRARLAVDKGRDDLAREALVERRRFAERVAALEEERAQHDALVEQYQADIIRIEEKLATAREKQRILAQRHARAQHRKRTQEHIRRVDNADALLRFDHIESAIERIEAEGDLVNFGRGADLEAAIDQLASDEDIERELQQLKDQPKPPAGGADA